MQGGRARWTVVIAVVVVVACVIAVGSFSRRDGVSRVGVGRALSPGSSLVTTTPPSPSPSVQTPVQGVVSMVTPSVSQASGGDTSYGGVQLGVGHPCFVPLPDSWQKVMAANKLWTGASSALIPLIPLPDKRQVLMGRARSGALDVVLRGEGFSLDHVVTSIPSPGGGVLSDGAASRDAVAFVYSPFQGDSAGAGFWDLYVWNRHTGEVRKVSSSPLDAKGYPLIGGYTRPVIAGGGVWWIEASNNGEEDAQGWAGSRLMWYDIATDRVSTVRDGLVTSLGAYGKVILVTQKVSFPGSAPQLRVGAYDAKSAAPVTPPAGLTLASDDPDWIVSDGDMVIWDGGTNYGLRAWRASWGRSIDLIPRPSYWASNEGHLLGYLRYPRIVGHFVVFQSGDGVWALDLRMDSLTELVKN